MLLEQAHKELGWPRPNVVREPSGSGARIYAEFAERKIGDSLRRQFPNVSVSTGVLTADPNSDSTEAPIAVVCEFLTEPRAEELQEAHRLAWNFSRTALLITLEPQRLIAWSCRISPKESLEKRQVFEHLDARPEQEALREMLQWVSLITGRILRQSPEKFPMDGRADVTLLKNLRYIRQKLLSAKLPREYCHDLLARVIFTQFLFHRKDSDGRPFMDQSLLKGRCEGVLKRDDYTDLASILCDKDDAYALFRWLDDKFNGDLFSAWKEEMERVTPKHLRLLADLVSGKIDPRNQQLNLWPQYSFDTIPLEFISSVYEEFLNEDRNASKAYYTPSHLVDFVLDAVLPWNDKAWNLKILDPCCGSGIFLVKSFQRLIHRWKLASGRDPLVSDLKPILTNNLFGVDRNEEAVRVASFSLYLAMADAIEPRHYWKQVVFPPLRGKRLIAQDFFDESTSGFRTVNDAGSYDLVVGNAPWGDGSIKNSSSSSSNARKGRTTKQRTTKAENWVNHHHWPVPNNDVGPVFLGKATHLVKPDGRVAMIQPAQTLLYHRAGKAEALRQHIFTSFTIDEVTNLTALRRDLFHDAISPACVVVLGRRRPLPQEPILYVCPKPLYDLQSLDRFVVEPQNVNSVTHGEAAHDSLVWVALAVGGRRDLELVHRLSKFRTLAKLQKNGHILKREGIIRGDRRRVEKQIKGKRFFSESSFPPNLIIDAESLGRLTDNRIHSKDSTDFEAFKSPQLLIKKTLSAKTGRFSAAFVRSSERNWGVICTSSYVSIRDLDKSSVNIKSAWIIYNSLVASYFMTTTSGRVSSYRQEGLASELLNVPLPAYSPKFTVQTGSLRDADSYARDAMGISDAEWVLMEDLAEYTIPDVLRRNATTPRMATKHKGSNKDSGATEPAEYVRSFVRVIKATFGEEKSVCATVFEEPDDREQLPVRLVAIHLDWPGHEPVKIERISTPGLLVKLNDFYTTLRERKSSDTSANGYGFQRVAFLFNSHQESSGRVRSLYVIKPDERRYWTRSIAMRDADQLSAALLQAAGRKQRSS